MEAGGRSTSIGDSFAGPEVLSPRHYRRSLWIYLQTVQAYLMMPLAGVFFAGVLWRRLNSTGVFAGIGAAALVCPVFIADSQRHFLPFLQSPLLRPWLHGALVAFVLCMIALAAGTYAAPPPAEERLATTTLRLRRGAEAAGAEALAGESGPAGRLRDYRIWLAAVLTTTTVLWYLMR